MCGLFGPKNLSEYINEAKRRDKKVIDINMHSDECGYRVFVEYRKKSENSRDKSLASLLLTEVYFEQKKGFNKKSVENGLETIIFGEVVDIAEKIEKKGLGFRVYKSGFEQTNSDFEITDLKELNKEYESRLLKML